MKLIPDDVLKLDKRVSKGYYSDKYFVRAVLTVNKVGLRDKVRMQVFQRNSDVCLCGVAEAVSILKDALFFSSMQDDVEIWTLPDGSIVNAWETVMLIEGPYYRFGQMETPLLGALKRGTMVATNVYRSIEAANGKPLLFFPARFDSHLVQAKDGYSYSVGREAAGGDAGGVSTDAQGEWWGESGMGTIPHALIAAFGGSTVKATLAFAECMDPEIKRVALVDFENDCVKTSLDVASAMMREYLRTGDDRYYLHGVRLDTSENMVDVSVKNAMDSHEYLGSFKPTGVNPLLVRNVYNELRRIAKLHGRNTNRRKFYDRIGIVVSGGFNAEKIVKFEAEVGNMVTAYAVGSSLFEGKFDFTADVVQIEKNGKWIGCAKKGRKYIANPKLERVI